MACVRVCPAAAIAVEGQQVRIVDEVWGTMIRRTCPVVVKTVKTRYPELIPYLAPVATPVAAEARYLKRLYGPDTPVVYAGVCLTESGGDLDAVITYQELKVLLERR